MIRKATPADIPAIVELGLEAMNKDAYTNLVISQEGVETMVRECVSAAKHFCWVAQVDGAIGGALTAMVSPLILYERNYANVLMWYCKIPGDGAALMRQFLQWVRSRPSIKMIQYTGERNADPRVGKLAARLGLNHQLPLYINMT
jgi:hypothetical protein